jgi:signal-transduction protein with cAMP-binding, CBS, and nucleotidyltransferase domain
MSQIKQYLQKAVTVPASAPVREAAQRMRSEGVGVVVVLADDGHPVGLVTDRDLALRVVGMEREAGITPTSAVMTHPLVVVSSTDTLERIIGIMASNGIRRVPVLRDKEVMGILNMADLLIALSGELHDLGEATRREGREARQTAQIEQVRLELKDTFLEIEDKFQQVLEEIEQLRGQAHGRIVRQFEAVRERLLDLLS